MAEKATTIDQYMKALPTERREALEAIRKVINKNLGAGFEEGIQYGMPAWFIPHSVYPDGYHCDPKQPLPYASVASQKNHMAIYLFCMYAAPGAEEEFRKAWLATGRKLDMGKSCVRFKKLDDVALDVVASVIKKSTAKKFIAHYESSIKTSGTKSTKKAAAKKAAPKKVAAKKKSATKKVAAKKTAKKTARKKST